MPKKNRRITTYTLKKATEHLFYEVWMFFETLVLLTRPRDQKEVNILLDAFAIHTRNLFYFLYPKKQHKQDDMLATDFIKNPKLFNSHKTKKEKLIFIVRKTDKQVAHLTYVRNRYNPNTKSWPFVDIGRKMHKTLSAFYDSLPKSYVNWPDIIRLKTILDSNNRL